MLDGESCLKWLATLVLHFHHISSATGKELTANLSGYFHPMYLAVDNELATPTLLGRAVATISQGGFHHIAATYGTLTNYILVCHFCLSICAYC
jgi:hypothetical protein